MKLGNVETISIDLKEPKMQFDDIKFNQISLFCGLNGSGKSILLKMVWATGTAAVSKILKNLDSRTSREFTQYIFDKSFDNTFTGCIKCTFQSGVTAEIHLEDGKCETPVFTNLEKVDSDVNPPIYMSVNTRTFQDIQQYVNIRLKKSKELMLDESTINYMTDLYKLYDVVLCEKRYCSAVLGTDIPPTIGETLFKDYGFKSKPVKIIYDEGFKLIYEDESVEKITSMGNGHQAILNMMTIQL